MKDFSKKTKELSKKGDSLQKKLQKVHDEKMSNIRDHKIVQTHDFF